MFEIRKTFGKTLPVGVLFSAPTVVGLAKGLDRGVEAPGLISVAPIVTSLAGPPIFMIHLIERDLARQLGRRHSVYGLAFGLAAAGSGEDADWPQNIESFAQHYIGQMRSVRPLGPYRLFGHSLGGLIAYEMARKLAEAGETVEFLVCSIARRLTRLGSRVGCRWPGSASTCWGLRRRPCWAA